MIEADLVVHGIGQLVTCEPTQGEGPLGLLEHAAVAARDGQIVWVGPTSRWQGRLELMPDAVIVDAHGGCVLPGFVDAHSHLLWTGSRAGPRRTSPLVTSNSLPWHGHVTVVPSSSPSASEHP